MALALTAAGTAWLLPARAQDHGAAPPAGEHALPPRPTGEHAAPAQHAPQPGHRAEEHSAAEHGTAGGHQEEGAKFDIHLPTWLNGLLQRFYHSGPATLTAAGAATPDGRPIPPAELAGKTAEYRYQDHHSHVRPYPECDVRPVVGHVGGDPIPAGAHPETVRIDGREVLLLDPQVKFAYASMFPEALVISLLTAVLVAVLLFLLTRNLRRVPGRMQVLLEWGYEALDHFVGGLIGPGYQKYLPLIGTAFVYIFLMNIGILIPGWAAATANVNVTAGMALVVVTYVQIEGIRANGVIGYLRHFAGEPWWLFWLNFPIHVIGEAAKLLSLSIRLFGNIFGEDTVIIILIGLGIAFTKGLVPFQLPMYLLTLFAGGVQALVFCILTCVYIALMTVHDHGEEHGHAAAEHAPAH